MVGIAELGRPVDDVLAVVVDVGPAAVGERGGARLLHGAGGHQRAARPGGLAEAELARRVDDDVDARRVDAELLGGDLQGDGVHALAHLGPAVADLDARRSSARCGSARRRPDTSRKPLPRPEFFSPSPSPTALPAATAAS